MKLGPIYHLPGSEMIQVYVDLDTAVMLRDKLIDDIIQKLKVPFSKETLSDVNSQLYRVGQLMDEMADVLEAKK